jgi:hypothetical protein
MKIRNPIKAIAVLCGLSVAAGGVLATYKSCTRSNSEEFVGVMATLGYREFGNKGAIRFSYKDKNFIDEGFDGSLDSVIFFEDGKRIELTKDNPGFEGYIPIYERAREIATRGRSK